MTPSLVGGGSHYAPIPVPSNYDRQTDEFGASKQLNGHIERVHINMEDHARFPGTGHRTDTPTSTTRTGGDSFRSMSGSTPINEERRLSALPSVTARAVAFVGVLLGGLAGGLIGHSLVDIQCSGDCGVPTALGLVAGAMTAALGMAVVGVLALRAMGEWREIQDRERAGHGP